MNTKAIVGDERQSAASEGHEDHDIARNCVAQGYEHEKRGNWLAAIESYNTALAADPQDPLVRYFANNNLGYSLVQIGRFDEAEEYCEAAIAIEPAQYNAHKNLGLALQGQGRCLDAAFSFLEATHLSPGEPRAWRLLEQLLTAHPALLEQSAELREAVARFGQLLAEGQHRQVH